MARLRRRGPDGQGVWTSPSDLIRLGHTRLAILDLSERAAQPMTLGDRAPLALTFNGEIYNAPELRSRLKALGCRFHTTSDTEVLLQAFACWGLDAALALVRGMYAFILWDERERTLHAAVDHAGMKPLAFAASPDFFAAASDTDALREILDPKPAFDPLGLCHVLCIGYCPAPHTVWKGVSKLGPGQVLSWRPGREPVIRRYWSPPAFIAEESQSPFDRLWEKVIGEHLLSDVPVGLFLSAGTDSTAVALALSRIEAPVRCFSLGLPSRDDESLAALATAAHLGLRADRIDLADEDVPAVLQHAAAAFDEPQAFGALITQTAICRATRPHGKVMLTGDGGDEAFGGYIWHRQSPAPADRRWAPSLSVRVAQPDADASTRRAALDALASRSFIHAYLQSVMPRFHPEEAEALLAPLGARYDDEVYAAWAAPLDAPSLPWPRRAQRLDLLTFCPGSILPKLDRASMAVGLELRAPFLDRRVLEWAVRRPPRIDEADPQRSKPDIRKYLTGRVPSEVLLRHKQGFSLRLGDSQPWSALMPWLAESRLVREGVLHPQWSGFIQPDTPYAESKRFALCMLAAWAQERL